jgi:hypothetical protein
VPANCSKVFCLTQDVGRTDFYYILGDHRLKEDLSTDTSFDPFSFCWTVHLRIPSYAEYMFATMCTKNNPIIWIPMFGLFLTSIENLLFFKHTQYIQYYDIMGAYYIQEKKKS